MKQIFHTKWFMATIAIVAALAVLVGGFLLVAKWIVPASTYRKAEGLVEAGDYEQAYTLFRSLGNFRDAKDRLNDFLWVCDSYTTDDAAMGKNIGTYTYDKNGKILSMTSGTSDATIVCKVDRKGRILTREYKNFTPSSKEEYTYDRKGNVIKAVVEQVSEEITRSVMFEFEDMKSLEKNS